VLKVASLLVKPAFLRLRRRDNLKVIDDRPRLIEVAFPLKQASLDSVHEKNVRHGHISTLHIWPARRPLAACRAALIATLLPDPGNDAERQKLLERLAGTVRRETVYKKVGTRRVPVLREYTEGGILHWGRENSPDLDFFREEIKKAYGGRPPRVLDPFAGGGAIPLEAMRLGCEVTAIDINPVAWFILKCTLEYPQRLAGQKRPLPRFALESPEFMADFWKASGNGRKNKKSREQSNQPSMLEVPEVDLSWHVRAWGYWVLERARKDLERFYPTIDGKPTVAYLWARTVTCKNCRATLPLLKTLWLCKKDNRRYRLQIKRRPDKSGVDFEVVEEPVVGGNAAQRREHDRRVGQGTMSRSGAWCPVCASPNTVAMTLDDIRAEGMAGRLGAQMTAVVVDAARGKEYRPPTLEELSAAQEAAAHVEEVFKDIPFGLPAEPLPTKEALGFRVPLYGFNQWYKLFTPRQLVALGTFVKHTRAAREAMRAEGYTRDWVEALSAYLALAVDQIANRSSTVCTWTVTRQTIRSTFARYALPITWDFAEPAILEDASGGYPAAITWVALYITHALTFMKTSSFSNSLQQSALYPLNESFDIIVTDPPYYDAIPYSDAMDFFYVWLRRTLHGLSSDIDKVLHQRLAPKWDHERNDGELIDDPSRFSGDAEKSQAVYEDGMFRAFRVCHGALKPDGYIVIVFANKQPDAWETLVSSMIRAGFLVEASWPIQTEMTNRTRAMASSALASSVWLVCRKRTEAARPGWDNRVLEEMRSRIYDRLRTFWDAGIRGPDFVWAATGPALEAYSKHPVVKKADEPNAVMTVSEFLQHVRRIVVDYVVGRVLSRDGESTDAESLDNLTIYYLLHRHDFGLEEAPVGACILYAQSCSLHDRDLVDRYDLLAYGKGKAAAGVEDESEEGEEGEDEEESATSGSTVKLKRWEERRGRGLGMPAGGQPAPLIDQIHRIMHLWKAGDVQKVDSYLEDQGLRRNPLFPRVMQAIIELARKDNQPDEVALLESIMNHITARGMHPQMRLMAAEE
jgi:adenine-specific DNA methylase